VGEEETIALNHVSCMGTKVVLDEGTVSAEDEGGGAVFGGDCWAAWRTSNETGTAGEGGGAPSFCVEKLNGVTGMAKQKDGEEGEEETESELSSRKLAEVYRKLAGEGEEKSINELKEGSKMGKEKRKLMERHPQFLEWGWRRR